MTDAVRTLDPVWIPLADGTRLAATLWLPADAEQAPVPAVLSPWTPAFAGVTNE